MRTPIPFLPPVALLMCLAVAGCTAGERSEASGQAAEPTRSAAGDPTGPPSLEAAPVGAALYDQATAPAAFTRRTALADCGVVLDIHTAWPSPATPNQVADSAVRDCWRSAREDRRGAEARIVAPSADSGPVFFFLRTTGAGAIDVWVSGKDRMHGPDAPVTWRHRSCTGVEPRNLVPVGCTDR